MNCILTIIKNEQFYLEEWIRYHCELGFDTLFIIEDIGSESHESITSKYDNVKLVKLSDTNDVHKDTQTHMLTEFYHNIIKKLDYKWCAMIDIDEFITGKSMSLFDEYDGECIHMNWHNYGANGLIEKPVYDRPIFDIYKKPCGDRNIDECFGKTGKMCYNVRRYNKNISLHDSQNMLIQSNIFLRHYITKSWEEWKWKLNVRGMHNPGNRHISDFFIYNPGMKDLKPYLLSNI